MKNILALAIAGFSIGIAGEAQACTDSSNIRHYFSYHPPAIKGDEVLLQVRVVSIDTGAATARLLQPYARTVDAEEATIEFTEPPLGDNCVDVGPTDGPVFVVARALMWPERDRVRLMATPGRLAPQRRPVRSPGELESYIVDPAYLPPKP